MKSRESELLFLYLTFDLIMLNVVLAILFQLSPSVDSLLLHDKSLYILHANLSWVLTYFVFSKKNLYLRDGYFNRVKRITKRIIIFTLVLSIMGFVFMPKTSSRWFIVEYIAVFYVAKILFYFVLYNYLKTKRIKGLHTNRSIIVGLNDTGLLLRQLIDSNPMLGYGFIGFLSTEEVDDAEVLGTPNQLVDIIQQHRVEVVFVTLSLFTDSRKSKELLGICNKLGVRLRFVPENQHWYKSRMNMESVGHFVVINPQEIPLDDIESRFLKRSFDLLFSTAVILLIFSWLFPIIAILIKLSSKGPVFFVQKRTGCNNRSFNCLKFRSMQVNDDADNKQATANDMRITRIGQFLRKSNLDEFPQFLNVFAGQMSIVGPRPHMLKHTEQYSKLIEHYLVRHYVKPGITGWAQVNGYRGETNELWKMEKRVELDMDYIESWNFWWDLKIVLLTVFGKSSFLNAR